MESRFEQFKMAISGINRYVQKIERNEMVKRGYKGAFAQYLAVLKRFEEGLTSSELCEICDKDKAAVSRIIAEMEEKGLISREHKKVRTYRTKIVLTEKGRNTADYVSERAKAAIAAVSDGVMDENQREVFYSTLEVLYKNLQKVSREGIPQEDL
ncbi:MAG: MarR family transcriptional regulator [Oscillospiraceae bacterium]|nr:MarR family transcriptional regulator [Oscillospiraceae bacterium]